MNKVWWSMIAVAFVWIGVVVVDARPPYGKEWRAKYVDEKKDPAFAETVTKANCNVCHKGMAKKDHNDYGLALKKSWNPAGFNAVKNNEAALKKYIADGLEKAEAEKSSSGKTFGELIKSGKLPGG
jgi:hypothetical protein